MNFRIQPTFVTLTWRSAFKDEVNEEEEEEEEEEY